MSLSVSVELEYWVRAEGCVCMRVCVGAYEDEEKREPEYVCVCVG